MSSSSSSNSITSIRHLTHPDHPLVEFSENRVFICGGCGIVGFGKRYKCQMRCKFDMHLFCAGCPRWCSSSLHNHKLELKNIRKIDQEKQGLVYHCSVCGKETDGMFYKCNETICNFDVHPICTRLPRSVNHVTDASHQLELKYPPPSSLGSMCIICHKNISEPLRGYPNILKHLMCYRCDHCSINIHIECISTPVVPQKYSPSTTRSCQMGNAYTNFLGPASNQYSYPGPFYQHHPYTAAAGVSSIGWNILGSKILFAVMGNMLSNQISDTLFGSSDAGDTVSNQSFWTLFGSSDAEWWSSFLLD